METASPNSTACTLSRAKGLLAGLITGQDLNANTTFFQSSQQWEVLQQVRFELEAIRLRLVRAKHTIRLARPDRTLNSFDNLKSFCEVAVSGFHNTSLGLPPTTLGGVVALCAMSHVTSCYLFSIGDYVLFNPLCDFDLWSNAISDHDHRQPFNDLVNAACIKPYFDALIDTLSVSQFSNGIYDEALDSADLGDTIHDNLSQDEQTRHNVSGGTQLITYTQVPDLQSLQGSPIVVNFAHFLEQCGELPLILSGPVVAANEWHPIGICKPEDECRVRCFYMQLLQDDSCSRDPTVRGIMSIVERFIDLGYLQSVREIRDYLLLIGKELLPCSQVFLNFCQLIHESVTKAESRASSSNKIPCEMCGELFTRRTNMRRHMNRKHGHLSADSTPTVSGSPLSRVAA